MCSSLSQANAQLGNSPVTSPTQSPAPSPVTSLSNVCTGLGPLPVLTPFPRPGGPAQGRELGGGGLLWTSALTVYPRVAAGGQQSCHHSRGHPPSCSSHGHCSSLLHTLAVCSQVEERKERSSLSTGKECSPASVLDQRAGDVSCIRTVWGCLLQSF